MEEIKDILNRIKDLLSERYNLQVLILFGSYSRNSQTPESDIDIAIKTSNCISKLELFDLKNELEDIARKDIDIVDLESDISDGFKYEILVNGIVLYCQNQFAYDMYKLGVMREYMNLNEARQAIINQIREEGSSYGK